MAADSEKPIDHRQMKAFVDRIVKLDESDDMINARVFDWSERKEPIWGELCDTFDEFIAYLKRERDARAPHDRRKTGEGEIEWLHRQP